MFEQKNKAFWVEPGKMKIDYFISVSVENFVVVSNIFFCSPLLGETI